MNSVITIVKPDFMKYSKGEYEKIFLSHFLSTGAIIFSNTQNYTTEQIDQSLLKLCDFAKSHNEKFNISNIEVFSKKWSDFTTEDYQKLSNIGYSNCEHERIFECHINIIENHFFLAKFKKYEDIEDLLSFLFNNAQIFRIKGYVMIGNKEIYAINCTDNCTEIRLSDNKHAILNVLGKGLDIEGINRKVAELGI